ncbi:MAG: VanZ family protein [Eubacteriales bacterium]
MLQKIFLWFYCLPIIDVLLLTVLFSAVYLELRRLFGQKRFWKPTVEILLVICLAVIGAATLTDRTPSADPADPRLIPFYSYYTVFTGGNPEFFRSNLMNAVLFYPAGLFACDGLPEKWSGKRRILLTVLALALISIGIEFLQYRFALGQAETDDVIHNTLGALAGAVIASVRIQKASKNEQTVP